jgi:hypothetical protein
MVSAEQPLLDRSSVECNSIERRIAHLERENLRLSRRVGLHSRLAALLGLVALVSGLAGAAVSQGIPLVLQTKRLELLNDAGKVVLLATASIGGGELELYDAVGRQVIRLSSPTGGGALELLDDRGQPVLSALATSAGAVIKTASARGEPQLELTPGDGGAALRLASPSGTGGIELVSGPLGGGLAIQGAAGSPLLTASPLGSGLYFAVHGGPDVPSVLMDTSAQTTLALRAGSGADLVAARAGPHGGELLVANFQGEPVFSTKASGGAQVEPSGEGLPPTEPGEQRKGSKGQRPKKSE